MSSVDHSRDRTDSAQAARPVFQDVDRRQVAMWGNHTVRMRHTLAGRDLFSDESLAHLIETIDPRSVVINTMGDDVSTWGHCDASGLPGSTVLDAVRNGRIWINMMAIEKVDPRFGELLEQMYSELEGTMPDFTTFKRKLGLLISSPRAKVFYHFDVAGQALWQIRGRKRIWIYPATEPFLAPAHIENVICGRGEEEVPYEPWFDDHAEVHELEPGDMLHWGLNGPHRVENLDMLNVSLTTEHWTDEIRRSFARHYGNGVLRNTLRWRPRSRSTDGPAFWAKVALTAAWRTSGQHRRQGFKRVLGYRIDPDAPLGRVPVPEQERTAVVA
jgi:hypothetical protein